MFFRCLLHCDYFYVRKLVLAPIFVLTPLFWSSSLHAPPVVAFASVAVNSDFQASSFLSSTHWLSPTWGYPGICKEIIIVKTTAIVNTYTTVLGKACFHIFSITAKTVFCMSRVQFSYQTKIRYVNLT